MTLDEGLFFYLDHHATLRPLLTGGLWPLLAPQQAPMPFLVYAEIFYESPQHFLAAAEIARATYQLDIYAKENRQAHRLGDTLRLALDGYHGPMGDVDVRRASLTNRRMLAEDDERGGQEVFYRMSSEYDVWHFRTVTTF